MSDTEKQDTDRSEAISMAVCELLPLIKDVIIKNINEGKSGDELVTSATDAAEAYYKGVTRFIELIS